MERGTSILQKRLSDKISPNPLKSFNAVTNLRGVVLLNIPKDSDVVGFDKVDGDTLAAESTGTTDAMNVQLTIAGGEERNREANDDSQDSK